MGIMYNEKKTQPVTIRPEPAQWHEPGENEKCDTKGASCNPSPRFAEKTCV